MGKERWIKLLRFVLVAMLLAYIAPIKACEPPGVHPSS